MIGTENPHSYATRGVYRTSTHWRVRDFPAVWEKKRGKAGDFSFLDGKRTEIPDLAEKEVFPEEVTTHYFKDGEYYPIEVNHPWKETNFYQSSPYEAGIIEVRGYKEGQEVVSHSHSTAGEPHTIRLKAVQEVKKSGRQEIAEIEIDILDKNEVFCPKADLYLSFEIKGLGKLIATENGAPLDLSSYTIPKRRTFRGKAKLYIKVLDESGKITVKAIGENLKSGFVEVVIK